MKNEIEIQHKKQIYKIEVFEIQISIDGVLQFVKVELTNGLVTSINRIGSSQNYSINLEVWEIVKKLVKFNLEGV
ncbi:MAG TPA: hypothetical protein VIH28_08315 [Ignavibacteriaceae bacterium]